MPIITEFHGRLCDPPLLTYVQNQATLTITLHPHEYPQATWTFSYTAPDAESLALTLRPESSLIYERQLPRPAQGPIPLRTLRIAP